MEVIIRSKSAEVSPSLQDHVNRRIDFCLGRFSHLIDFVRVDLIDLNGPKGGLDRQCEVKIKFIHHGLIVGKATDTIFETAASRAMERAVNQVKKILKHRLTNRTRIAGHQMEELVGA
jgi:ribosome-associated translation inhibitor RaiA